jgi:hypothetical protein
LPSTYFPDGGNGIDDAQTEVKHESGVNDQRQLSHDQPTIRSKEREKRGL